MSNKGLSWNKIQIASMKTLAANMRIRDALPLVINLKVFSLAKVWDIFNVIPITNNQVRIPVRNIMVTVILSRKLSNGIPDVNTTGPKEAQNRYDQGEVVTSTNPTPYCLTNFFGANSLPNSLLTFSARNSVEISILNADNPIFVNIAVFAINKKNKTALISNSLTKISAPISNTDIATKKSPVMAPTPVINAKM